MPAELDQVIATTRYYAGTAHLLHLLSRRLVPYTARDIGDLTAQTAQCALGFLDIARHRAYWDDAKKKTAIGYCRRKRGETGRQLAETLSYVLEEFVADDGFGDTDAAIETLSNLILERGILVLVQRNRLVRRHRITAADELFRKPLCI